MDGLSPSVSIMRASRLGQSRPVHVVVAMKSTSPSSHPARSSTVRTAAAPISMAPRSKRSLSWSTLSFGVKVSGSR